MFTIIESFPIPIEIIIWSIAIVESKTIFFYFKETNKVHLYDQRKWMLHLEEIEAIFLSVNI